MIYHLSYYVAGHQLYHLTNSMLDYRTENPLNQKGMLLMKKNIDSLIIIIQTNGQTSLRLLENRKSYTYQKCKKFKMPHFVSENENN